MNMTAALFHLLADFARGFSVLIASLLVWIFNFDSVQRAWPRPLTMAGRVDVVSAMRSRGDAIAAILKSSSSFFTPSQHHFMPNFDEVISVN